MARPVKCVTVTEGKDLQDNWMKSRAVDIKNAMGHDDCCATFYSVEELQEFLDYVRTESTTQGITNPGVRIYFSAYMNDSTNKATVILAPTKGNTNASETNYTIDPLNGGVSGLPPKKY